jgi:hypothetical protein
MNGASQEADRADSVSVLHHGLMERAAEESLRDEIIALTESASQLQMLQ